MCMFIKIYAINFLNSKAQGTILKVIALLLDVNVTLVSDIVKLALIGLLCQKHFFFL